MNRHWLRIWRQEDGAVSIYLVVATAAMLLLSSLLIDYARIAAYNKQSEIAAQSGIRSALSAYDASLYEQYGLFIAGGTDRNELFAQSVEHNWMEDKNEFQLLRIRNEATHVDTEEVLGNQEVFTRQVLEDMKYKAPIDFTMEIASRFAPMGDAMKVATRTVGTLEEVQKLYEEREKQLARVVDDQKQGGKRVSKLTSALEAVSEVVSGYGTFQSWLQEDSTLEEDEKPAHTEQIAAFIMRAQLLTADLKTSTANEVAKLESDRSKELAALQSAEQLNVSIATTVEQMRDSQEDNGSLDSLTKTTTTGSGHSEMSPEDLASIGDIGSAAKDLVLPSKWFADYRAELAAQVDNWRNVDAEAAAFVSAVAAAVSAVGGGQVLNGALGNLHTAYNAYSKLYNNPGTIVLTREDEKKQRQAHDDERKANEKAASVKWSEVKDMISGISSSQGKEEYKEAFEDVQRLAKDNLKFNAAAQNEDETDAGEGQAHDASDEAKTAMTSMGSMFGGMAKLLDGIRDPLYVNEYIVHRFNSFDPKLLKEMMAGGGQEAFSEALALDNQEIEYILYGFHEPGANVGAAISEIFGVRLAIRTMEGLIECRALGNPLLILSAAVLYGLEKAIADITSLAESGKMQLSKYMPIEVTYADYLRVFLILHGSGGAGRTSRVIAVIEHNTDVDLSNAATGISGELTSSVNLWFLPGLIRSFTTFGILNGKVKGNRYEKTQTIGISYG